MTTRLTAVSSVGLTLGIALVIGPGISATAATSAPELVGSAGQDYGPFYTLGDAVYGISFSSLFRLDGDAPEFVASGFPSVGQGVGFADALHIVTQDNSDPNFEANVLRITPDGTVTTTLDLNTGQFLGGVRGLGATDGALYASTWLAGGGVVRTSTDGTTWSTFTNPSPFPDSVTKIIGIGDDLYAQGSQSSPFLSGVFLFDGTTWSPLTIPGGVTTIERGVGRLLVGTSEGLYSVVGSTVTELVDDTVNPRTIAELDGVVYWVDDSNAIQALEEGVVSTPFPSLSAGANLTATASALYFTASADGVRSTYRIAVLPTGQPENPGGSDNGARDELAATGLDATSIAGFAGLAALVFLAGVALLTARSRSLSPLD